MLYDKKFYINRKVSYNEISILRKVSSGISESEIILPEIEGCKYILYLYYDDYHIEKNEKVNSAHLQNEAVDGLVSCDVYIFIGEEKPVRINLRKVLVQSIETTFGEKVYYMHRKGKTKNLVVYFNYSRLVEKVFLHNELITEIKPRTSDHLLMISNAFGYWGTSSLFDSNGNLIIPDVVKLINDILYEYNISEVIFIGGSQGATASLIYSNFFNHCRVVHAASPVPLNYKNQLRHMENKIKHDDLVFIEHLLHNSVKIRNVRLYTSSEDHYLEFVKELFSAATPKSELKIVEGKGVTHDGILRFFIKDIYKDLS